MIRHVCQTFIVQQNRAQDELGEMFDEIKEIFPQAGWFDVDRKFAQICFIPSPVLSIAGTKLGLLRQATGAEQITVQVTRIGPGDSGLRPLLVLSGVRKFPQLVLNLSELR
jgi:hypothetical protein